VKSLCVPEMLCTRLSCVYMIYIQITEMYSCLSYPVGSTSYIPVYISCSITCCDYRIQIQALQITLQRYISRDIKQDDVQLGFKLKRVM